MRLLLFIAFVGAALAAENDVRFLKENASGNFVEIDLSDPAEDRFLMWDDSASGLVWGSAGAGSGDLLAANNLSDVASAATSRTNLGLGSTDSPTFDGLTSNSTITLGASAGFTNVGAGTNFSIFADTGSRINFRPNNGLGGELRLGDSSDTSPNHFTIYGGGSDNEPGYIKLYDDAGTGYDIWASTAGDLRFGTLGADDDTGGSKVLVDGGTITSLTATSIDADSLLFNEKAASTTVGAGTGEIWVKNTAGSSLWFTDDTDTDLQVAMVSGALGTPTSATLTNATGLPVSTGVSGLGSGTAGALALGAGETGGVAIDGSIDAAAIEADAVTGAKIIDDAIDSEHYAAGSIDNEHLAADIISGDEIADNAVETSHLGNAVVTAAKLSQDALAVYVEKHGANHTISADECYGGVHIATAGIELTLPAGATGMNVTIKCRAASATDVIPDSGDLIYLDSVAGDDGDKATSPGAVGDIIVLVWDGTDWEATSNGWTETGP